MVCPPKTVTHPSTNRAWCTVTSLIRPTTLPLRHATPSTIVCIYSSMIMSLSFCNYLFMLRFSASAGKLCDKITCTTSLQFEETSEENPIIITEWQKFHCCYQPQIIKTGLCMSKLWQAKCGTFWDTLVQQNFPNGTCNCSKKCKIMPINITEFSCKKTTDWNTLTCYKQVHTVAWSCQCFSLYQYTCMNGHTAFCKYEFYMNSLQSVVTSNIIMGAQKDIYLNMI